MKPRKYPYTHIKIDLEGYVVAPSSSNGVWHQVPVIGDYIKLNLVAILVPNFCVGDEITLFDLKKYNIEPEYLGLRMILINECHLKSNGINCDSCNDYYEHLGSIYYDFFQCWKCEV